MHRITTDELADGNALLRLVRNRKWYPVEYQHQTEWTVTFYSVLCILMYSVRTFTKYFGGVCAVASKQSGK